MKLPLKKHRISLSLKYCVSGALFGCLFPILAVLLRDTQQLLPIIFTAPLILGIVFYVVGVKQQKISKLLEIETFGKSLEQDNTQLELVEFVGGYGCWQLDLATNSMYWSKGLYSILGLNPNETTPDFDVFLKTFETTNQSQILNKIEDAKRSVNTVINIAGLIIRPDLVKCYVRGSVRTITNKNNDSVKLIGTIQDITDLINAQEKANSYRNALDQAAIVSITDAKGKIIFANDKFVKISGYSREELIGKDHRLLNSGYHSKEFFMQMWTRILSGHLWSGEICNKNKSGELYWVDTTIAPTLTMDKNVLQFVSIRYEITNRKKAELEIIEAKRKAENSQKQIEGAEIIGQFGSWDLSLKDHSFSCSKGFRRILNYPEESPVSYRDFIASVHNDDREMLEQAMEESALTQQPFSLKYRVERDNVIKWLQTEGNTFYNKEDQTYKLTGTIQDVTEKINTEMELTTATIRADEATRIKSQFLANMSHEIRTPMNGLIGISSILLSELTDPNQKEKIKIIYNCSNNLLHLINDILDFSKVEAGKIELESKPFNIHDVTQEVIQLMNTRAAEKGLPLIYNKDTTTSWFSGDTTRFRQILVNLVSNAIKFTEFGEIIISSKITKQIDERYEIHFSVKDSGVGIPKDIQAKLFSSFTQADASTTRKFGGTGLGLAISKGLCERMGGRIWVDSEAGKGSTFNFTMILDEATPVENYSTDVFTFDGELAKNHPLRILIAEDNQVNQLVAKGFLQKLGYLPDLASNGLEVLKHLQNKNYDVIFMDNHMPEMDGLQTTKAIYEKYDESNLPHIIALTASVMKEDIIKMQQAGMKDILSKPIQLGEIIRVLRSVPPNPDSLSFQKHNKPLITPIISSHDANFSSFNFKAFISNFQGMEDLAYDTTQNFLDSLPKLLKDVETALSSKIAADLEISAHTLKGAISNFHAQSTKDLAFKLELLGRENKIQDAEKIFEELKIELFRLTTDLKKFLTERRAA